VSAALLDVNALVTLDRRLRGDGVRGGAEALLVLQIERRDLVAELKAVCLRPLWYRPQINSDLMGSQAIASVASPSMGV
jgi:hypothetical protein